MVVVVVDVVLVVLRSLMLLLPLALMYMGPRRVVFAALSPRTSAQDRPGHRPEKSGAAAGPSTDGNTRGGKLS